MKKIFSDISINRRDQVQIVILILGVNSAAIYYNLFEYKDIFNLINIVSKLCLTLSIYFFLQILFKRVLITHLLLFLAYFISYTADFFNVIILRQYISFDNINSIYFTNQHEAAEFISPLTSYLFLPIAVILILLINIILLPKGKNYQVNLIPNFIVSFSLASFSFLFLGIDAFSKISVLDSKKNNESLLYRTWDRFLKTPPVNIPYRSWQLYVSVKRVNKVKALRDNFKFQTTRLNENPPKTVVFIISEGIRSANWSINGYSKLTDPNLSQRKGIVSLKEHYANGNNTYKSIPLLITLATPANPLDAYKEKSIISLFKEAGYKTVWISNQDIFYLHNREEADSTLITYNFEDRTDLAVLKHVENILANNNSTDLFLLVNLVGNHGVIPNPFNDQFKPNSSKDPAEMIQKNKEKIMNDYDNKILLQDHVLNKIISSVRDKGESSVVLYTADHGLNLFDTADSNVFGYGADNPTKYDLNIPLFIWGSDEYINQNREKYENLLNNVNSFTDNDDIMYTLPDLCGLTFSGFDATKSISSDKYVSKSIVQVHINQSNILFDVKLERPKEFIKK